MYVIEQWLNGTIIFVSETRIKRKHSSETVNWKTPPGQWKHVNWSVHCIFWSFDENAL